METMQSLYRGKPAY